MLNKANFALYSNIDIAVRIIKVSGSFENFAKPKKKDNT
jgi:hypothetical protein